MALALGSLTTGPLVGLGGIRSSCNPFLSKPASTLSTKRPMGVSLHLTSNQPTRVSSRACVKIAMAGSNCHRHVAALYRLSAAKPEIIRSDQAMVSVARPLQGYWPTWINSPRAAATEAQP